jgi:hypothetical protein
MIKNLLFFFLLSIVFDSNSQTIVNILSPDTIDFVSNRRVKEIIETFSGNGEETVLSYNANGQLNSRIPVPNDFRPKFSLIWEYKNSLPTKRVDIKEFNNGKEISYYLYEYDSNGYLVSVFKVVIL